jgi:hypothetical protein
VKQRLIALALAVALAACGGGGPRTFHTNSPIQALAKAKAEWTCELNAEARDGGPPTSRPWEGTPAWKSGESIP